MPLFSCLRLSLTADLWGPPSYPAHLVPLVTGAKPVGCLGLQLALPFLRDPGRAGDAPAPGLSFRLVLEQPSATRVTLQPREGPQATQTSLRTM